MFREDSHVASGHFGADGTFPKLKFFSDTDLKGKYTNIYKEKKWLRLSYI
ncbi:MAG: hypothetical protein ACTSQO_00615 [Candidatus Helarchaeota archaeon]